MAQLPILAITAGDPAGAGPEITARAFANDSVYEMCRPVVIGDPCMMQQALVCTGLNDQIRIHVIEDVKDAVL